MLFSLPWRVEDPRTINVVVGSSAGLDVDCLLAATSNPTRTLVELCDLQASCGTLKIKRSATDKLFLGGGAANGSHDRGEYQSFAGHAGHTRRGAEAEQHAVSDGDAHSAGSAGDTA